MSTGMIALVASVSWFVPGAAISIWCVYDDARKGHERTGDEEGSFMIGFAWPVLLVIAPWFLAHHLGQRAHEASKKPTRPGSFGE